MKVVNKNKVLLLIGIMLFILGQAGINYLIYKDNNVQEIPKVKLKSQETKNDTFAIMLEQSDGTYQEANRTSFNQSGYVFNNDKSGCIDANGNKIDNSLSYNALTKAMVVSVSNTSFCYVYFDKSLGLQIKDTNPNRLSTDVKGEMYRFQGKQTDNVENYICFGTSNKDTCTTDTDHYMYRIIGIEAKTGRVKIIKKEALNDAVQWYTDKDHDIKFPESKLYEAINGEQFLTNTAYVPTEWQEKILGNTWTYGDMLTNDILGARQTGEGLYLAETGKKDTQWNNWADENTPEARSTTVKDDQSSYYGNTVYYTIGKGKWTDTFTSKVSLMYLHDYYYSVSDTANCEYNEGKYAECQTGWMHLSQNDTTAPREYEWTMSRYGWSVWSGYFFGRYVKPAGDVLGCVPNSALSVRPVFYIDASNKLLDGIGTIENPFIVRL